jgi:hypothetical protein
MATTAVEDLADLGGGRGNGASGFSEWLRDIGAPPSAWTGGLLCFARLNKRGEAVLLFVVCGAVLTRAVMVPHNQ